MFATLALVILQWSDKRSVRWRLDPHGVASLASVDPEGKIDTKSTYASQHTILSNAICMG